MIRNMEEMNGTVCRELIPCCERMIIGSLVGKHKEDMEAGDVFVLKVPICDGIDACLVRVWHKALYGTALTHPLITFWKLSDGKFRLCLKANSKAFINTYKDHYEVVPESAMIYVKSLINQAFGLVVGKKLIGLIDELKGNGYKQKNQAGV